MLPLRTRIQRQSAAAPLQIACWMAPPSPREASGQDEAETSKVRLLSGRSNNLNPATLCHTRTMNIQH
jgi:hypothetical protein